MLQPSQKIWLRWLNGQLEKFGYRVISRLTNRHWPAKSPDLSPLDYWFCSLTIAALAENPPATIDQLLKVLLNR